jgi:hypothetical protein
MDERRVARQRHAHHVDRFKPRSSGSRALPILRSNYRSQEGVRPAEVDGPADAEDLGT